MERHLYYSITEVRKLFKASNKAIQEAIAAHQIPVLTKDVDLGTYAVKALYYLKEDIEKLNLPLRPKA